MTGRTDGPAMSLLNLLLRGRGANHDPQRPQLVGRADARQPPTHPASGSELSQISKLMSFSGSAPGSMCINEGCAATIGHTKETSRQLLYESQSH